MADMLVLNEDEVRQALPLDELAEALTEALVGLAEGTTSAPPRVAAFTPDGLLGSMPGYVPGPGLAAKLVSVYPGNRGLDIPTHQALIAVFDVSTGAPCAVMGATYITAVRTAMVSAVVARALARPDCRSLAVLGAGVQASAHITAIKSLLKLEEVRVSSRDPSRASALAAQHPGAVAIGTAKDAVMGADIVFCCTGSRGPVLEHDWVAHGAHVSSVGSGAELPPDLLDRASVYVESSGATAPPPAGALELQGRDPLTLTEVGAMLGQRRPGRSSPDEVTVFKSTGHAVEDVAAAAVVRRRALAMGIGTTLPFT